MTSLSFGGFFFLVFLVSQPLSDIEETSSRLHLRWVVFFLFNAELRESTAFKFIIGASIAKIPCDEVKTQKNYFLLY